MQTLVKIPFAQLDKAMLTEIYPEQYETIRPD